MAEGRFLSKKISLSRQMAQLGSDTSRLLFTWTIAHLDVEGRIHGDPQVLRALVVPRLSHIDDAAVEQMIREWVRLELAIWYEAAGDLYLFFPAFERNQRGLRKDKSSPSVIPPPEEGRIKDGATPEQGRSTAETTLEQLPPNISKGNISKGNTSGTNSLPTTERPAAAEPQLPPPAKRNGHKKDLAPEDRELYHTLEAGFLKKNDGQFTNWQKEGQAIKSLIKKAKARAPDYPDDFLKAVARKFWELKNGDTSGRGFWRGQPFTPSALNADGIFDRVVEQFREAEVDEDLKEYYRERGIDLETGEFLEVG